MINMSDYVVYFKDEVKIEVWFTRKGVSIGERFTFGKYNCKVVKFSKNKKGFWFISNYIDGERYMSFYNYTKLKNNALRNTREYI